jgi:hypothetical protein
MAVAEPSRFQRLDGPSFPSRQGFGGEAYRVPQEAHAAPLAAMNTRTATTITTAL